MHLHPHSLPEPVLHSPACIPSPCYPPPPHPPLPASPPPQDWTAERSVKLGLAVSRMLKGYTTMAATIITAGLKSVTRFTMQVGPGAPCLVSCSRPPVWCNVVA